MVVSKMYEFCLFIARLQPPHKAHIDIIRLALSKSVHVGILLGSHRSAANIKNPWSADFRETLVRACFTAEENERITFIPIKDYPYNDLTWVTQVQQKVGGLLKFSRDVAIIGHHKDRSSYYLKLFPQWEFINSGLIHEPPLNATDVRNILFEDRPIGGWEDNTLYNRGWESMVCDPAADLLKQWKTTEQFERLKDEYNYIKEYKKLQALFPYPITFVTTDAIVTKSGHILLIRRGGNPGKGLLALPGGFLNPEERIVDCCVRELKEETRIHVDLTELKPIAAKAPYHVFDHPDRSLRGRTISHAYHLALPEDGRGLPFVKGSDDAVGAGWYPIGDLALYEDQFFEDHLPMCDHFLRVA